MSSPDDLSSSSGGAESANPYAASPARDGANPDPALKEEPRQYQIRMAWADRRRFLRAVGPLRVVAMGGAVVGVWGLYGLLRTSFEFSRLAKFENWSDAIL